MPLTNWICSSHQTVSLDHWSSGECSLYSNRMINTILSKEQNDTNHKGFTLTPTTVLACPRQTLIERFLPYAASPDALIAMSVGTWAHSGIDSLKVPVKGVLFTHKMVGEIDAVDGGILEEDKFTGAKAMKRYLDQGPSSDHIAQVSMDKLLHEQAYNNIDECAINYYMCGAAHIWKDRIKRKLKPYIRYVIEPMTEKQLLAHKPGGGNQTVMENIGQLVRSFEAIKVGADPIDVIRSLPLAGATMYYGTKCKEYCTVKTVCLDDIEGRKGW